MSLVEYPGETWQDYTLIDRTDQVTSPAPFLVLRTLKGGEHGRAAPGRAEALAAQDLTGLINGKRGIVQLVAG